MNTINLKDAVQRAIQSEWPSFEREHPHLAAAIDQQLLAEQAVQSLADDPEFQSTLAQASTEGLIASTVTELITRFVTQWLKRLI